MCIRDRVGKFIVEAKNIFSNKYLYLNKVKVDTALYGARIKSVYSVINSFCNGMIYGSGGVTELQATAVHVGGKLYIIFATDLTKRNLGR